MRRFYDDSSQGKVFSKDRSIKLALRYLSEKPLSHFELRDYSCNPYKLIDTFTTKGGAQIAKEFAVLQYGAHFAVVAVDPYTSNFNRPRG